MKNTKKTLVIKVSHDATNMSNAVIDMLKAAIRTQGIDNGLKEEQIDFELLYSNDEGRVLQLFRRASQDFQASEDEIREAEKSDGFQEFLSLFASLYGDEDEVVHDEE